MKSRIIDRFMFILVAGVAGLSIWLHAASPVNILAQQDEAATSGVVEQDDTFEVANDATVLYTLADGQLSVLIPHRFNVVTGEATDGEIHILKDHGSPPKIKVFPTNSIRRLDLNWRETWVDEKTVQRGAHLYINPVEFGSRDLSAELAAAYTRRQQILGPGQ